MNRIKAMVTQVLNAPDVVPSLAKYIAGNIKGASEEDILKSIKAQAGDLEGKQFIRKFYSAEKIDVVESERSVVGVISTKAKDRDREIVDPDGVILSDYQKNRVVLYSHDYHSLPVGRNMWIKRKGDALIAKTEFAPRPADMPKEQPWLPDQIYHLMKEGFLNGFSIGFIPLEERELEEAETKAGVERAWSKWLMLEYSIVAVPSNPEAVAVEIKSGAINHPQLVSDLEIEIEEETKEMTTTKEAPQEEQVKTIEIAERGIWAELTEEGPQFYFDEEVYTDADSKAWIMTFGEAVKDILEDEVIKGEDGLPDPELLKAALDKLDMESTSGDGEAVVEIEGFEEEEDKEVAGEKAEPGTHIKTFDLEGRPSTSDIYDAIWRAIGKGPGDYVESSNAYFYTASLYPINYPSGQVVICKERCGEVTIYTLYDYIYEAGVVTLNNPVEVIEAWKEKGKENEAEKGTAGEGKGTAGEGTPPEATPGSPESKTAGEVMVKLGLDADEFMAQLKGVKDELAELRSGKSIPKNIRDQIEETAASLLELLNIEEKVAPVPPEEEEKEFEIEVEEKAQEEPITKEQIKELLSSPDGASFLKEQFARLSGKM